LTAFDTAWSLLKMPFVNRGLTAKKLYQGRRKGEEDTGYWTPHKDKAVAYAMFGSRNDWDDPAWVDPNVHVPVVYEVDAPDEMVNLPLDMEYVGLGDASGAVDRRRVAFHDKDGIISQYDPKPISDEAMSKIIQNIIVQNQQDKFRHGEDHTLMGGRDMPRSVFERIFDMRGALDNWEGMYVDDDEASHNDEIMDSLSAQYEEGNRIDWDSLTTTLGGVKGGRLNPFLDNLGGNAGWKLAYNQDLTDKEIARRNRRNQQRFEDDTKGFSYDEYKKEGDKLYRRQIG